MKNEIREISVQIAKEKAGAGIVFVDVREEDEVKKMSYVVSNLINIPLSQFEKRFGGLPKDKELILVCRRGRRSLIAAKFLLSQGFFNVVNMRGGILKWADKGFPVENNR